MKAKHGVAIDQHGQRFYFGAYCRRDLMQQIGCQHASKMFVDTNDGDTIHVGYVIAGHWLTVYSPVREAA